MNTNWASHWNLRFDDPEQERAFIDEHQRSSMPVIREAMLSALIAWGLCHVSVVIFLQSYPMVGGTLVICCLYSVFVAGLVISGRAPSSKRATLLQRVALASHVGKFFVTVGLAQLYMRSSGLAAVGMVTILANAASACRHRTTQVLWLMITGASMYLLALVYLVAVCGETLGDLGWAAPVVILVEVLFGVVTARANERMSRELFVKDGLLREQREQLAREMARSESLLRNVLPESIAIKLRDNPGIIAEEQPEASVLFADLAGFTAMSSDMTAGQVVEMLNEVFTEFDLLVERHGLEKIKTIGDCYMVASGVPQRREDHARVLVQLALEMRDLVASRPFSGRHINFRFGVNSGPVVAGVIGKQKFIYDLWGDTVNVASRMESNGQAGIVQVSTETRARLDGAFRCEPRGSIHMKGKGEMAIFHVTGYAPTLGETHDDHPS